MSFVEKLMLISACLMPVAALILFLPKVIKAKLANRQKKQKQAKQKIVEEQTQPLAEENKVSPMVKPETPKKVDDFKDFAEFKKRRVSAPKRNMPSFNDFPSLENPFRPPILNQPNPKPKTTIVEEINSLSPELKALIISGALDRKDFDDFNN